MARAGGAQRPQRGQERPPLPLTTQPSHPARHAGRAAAKGDRPCHAAVSTHEEPDTPFNAKAEGLKRQPHGDREKRK